MDGQARLPDLMHPCLNLDEIVRRIARELVTPEARASAVALALCQKSFEDPVLDVLWETQERLLPLRKCFPEDVWNEVGSVVSRADNGLFPFLNHLIWKTFKRLPTALEWARFRKYTQRMRGIGGFFLERFLSDEAISVLELYAAKEPFFPNMRVLDLLPCGKDIPLIRLFLSPRTTTVRMGFREPDICNEMVVSMITALQTLCPNLQDITLHPIQRYPIITAAVSALLLTSNRDTLRCFRVDSPLTEEAREVIYTHTNLRRLWAVIEGATSLPTLVLPNLTELDIEYTGHDHGWLQGFRGATFGRLASIGVHPKHKPIGDFLKAFESAALTASIQDSLSRFCLHTSYSWNPNYSSLLPFTRLTYLVIGSSCDDGCSSTVDDNIILDLARAMPKLETLQLGGKPCREPRTGVTVKGFAVLAHYCPDLSILGIHFQVASLSTPPAISGLTSSAGSTTQRRDCALEELDVGEMLVPEESILTVALTLAHIFPRIECITSDDFYYNWEKVVDAICTSREIVDYPSEENPFLESFGTNLVIPPQDPYLKTVVNLGATVGRPRSGSTFGTFNPHPGDHPTSLLLSGGSNFSVA